MIVKGMYDVWKNFAKGGLKTWEEEIVWIDIICIDSVPNVER